MCRSLAQSVENAICHFEKTTDLRVTIHDIQHRLWSLSSFNRFFHAHPLCQVVKSGSQAHRCVQFEIEHFRAKAEHWKNGRIHQCHAGLVELALPVFQDNVLLFVLFAGPVTEHDAGVTRQSVIDYRSAKSAAAAEIDAVDLQDVTALVDNNVEEGLQQLAARIRCILQDYVSDPASTGIDRKQMISRYIHDHYYENLSLQALGAVLGLSPERSRHCVQQIFGMSFRQLVNSERMNAAQAILLNTSIPVGEVAGRCGFSSSSAFTRAFRQNFGLSPLQWRRKYQG